MCAQLCVDNTEPGPSDYNTDTDYTYLKSSDMIINEYCRSISNMKSDVRTSSWFVFGFALILASSYGNADMYIENERTDDKSVPWS